MAPRHVSEELLEGTCGGGVRLAGLFVGRTFVVPQALACRRFFLGSEVCSGGRIGEGELMV